jgi:hypothetical protein
MLHDRLKRRLPADRSGQRLLAVAWRRRVILKRGDRLLDDSILPQPCATAMDGWAWGVSSQERRPVYRGSRVLLVWIDGTLRLPVGIRLWHKGGRLTGGLTGLVVRHGPTDEATHRLTLPAAEGRRLYRLRAQMAEVLRVCTDPLGLRGGHARTTSAGAAEANRVTPEVVPCSQFRRVSFVRAMTGPSTHREVKSIGLLIPWATCARGM